jgi:hypothetical protein
MKNLFVMGCLLGASLAVALEKRDLGGLAVTVESIPEEVIVDGLALRIKRASGADVPQLAQRLQIRWRTEGSAVQSQQVEGWKSASRLDQGRNELIQWRGEGPDAELLHSSLVTGRLPRSRSRAPFALPGACAWGRVIEGVSGGSSFEQHTAQCAANAAALATAIQSRLQSLGWNIRSRMDAVWDVHRSGDHARLTLIEGPVPGSSSLVWLRVVSGDRR